MTQRKLEIPVFSPSAARAAAAQGAHRIELNAAGSYPAGGLTPSLGELADLLRRPTAAPRVPVRVMIRPRGAPHSGGKGEQQQQGPDFVYTDAELADMQASVSAFKASGLLDAAAGDGFVFGVLLPRPAAAAANSSSGLVVDVARNRALVELARPFPCVFHRAFDDLVAADAAASPCPTDPAGTAAAPDAISAALEAVISCGFAGILTSGGPGRAPDENNARALGRIVDLAAGRIQIIVGGGVRSGNVGRLASALGGAQWFHSSCLTGGGGEGIDEEEVVATIKALASHG